LEGLEEDSEWNQELKALEDLQYRIRRGPNIDLYKSQTSKIMEMSESVSDVEAEP